MKTTLAFHKKILVLLLILCVSSSLCACSAIQTNSSKTTAASLSKSAEKTDTDNNANASSLEQQSSEMIEPDKDALHYAQLYATFFASIQIENVQDIIQTPDFYYVLIGVTYDYFHSMNQLEEQVDEFGYTHAKITWKNLQWAAKEFFDIDQLTSKIFNVNAPSYYVNAEKDGYILYVPLELTSDFDKSIISFKQHMDIYDFEIEISSFNEKGASSYSKVLISEYRLKKLESGIFRLISIREKEK